MYHIKDIVPEGPKFRSGTREGNSVRLFFDNADGLRILENGAQSFCIIDAPGAYALADSAIVDGSTIVVSSKSIEFPSSVRYAWSDNPDSVIYNGAGLPASTFEWK